MGIYWGAVDYKTKTKIQPPSDHSCKYPGIFHPDNHFPGMVVMKNCQGYNYEIINDCDWEGTPLYDDEFKDITKEVHNEYLEKFPFLKEKMISSET